MVGSGQISNIQKIALYTPVLDEDALGIGDECPYEVTA
jgi:hypothetical protein